MVLILAILTLLGTLGLRRRAAAAGKIIDGEAVR
jgi:hypothetical protein